MPTDISPCVERNLNMKQLLLKKQLALTHTPHSHTCTRLLAGGCGLQLLSVTVKSLHLKPTFSTAAVSSGINSCKRRLCRQAGDRQVSRQSRQRGEQTDQDQHQKHFYSSCSCCQSKTPGFAGDLLVTSKQVLIQSSTMLGAAKGFVLVTVPHLWQLALACVDGGPSVAVPGVVGALVVDHHVAVRLAGQDVPAV